MSVRAGAPALVVFAKRPEPGRVKTRMCPPLSAVQAAELYSALLDDVLVASAASCAELGLSAVLAVHPAEACDELAARCRDLAVAFEVWPQRGPDLSARMTSALAEATAQGAAPVLLRGSDSPLLSTAIVREALAALESTDVVICPDLDGGYNLIGLRSCVPGLFDHEMSTGDVMRDTLDRAERAGASTHRLAPGFDLDEIRDLRELRAAHLRDSASVAALCPRTLAVLERLGAWAWLEA